MRGARRPCGLGLRSVRCVSVRRVMYGMGSSLLVANARRSSRRRRREGAGLFLIFIVPFFARLFEMSCIVPVLVACVNLCRRIFSCWPMTRRGHATKCTPHEQSTADAHSSFFVPRRCQVSHQVNSRLVDTIYVIYAPGEGATGRTRKGALQAPVYYVQ